MKRRTLAALAFAFCAVLPRVAFADADEGAVSNPNAGLQPITGSIPVATPAPGESRVVRRPDGAYDAIPDVKGRVHTFHIVERPAPWTLRPGLTVMATTYNGVVPGPTMTVNEGDTVVLDYENEDATPDTIHLHGIHDIPVSMDGVGGISQPLVAKGQHYVYRFVADTPGTFIYHTHDSQERLDSGLYGAIVVLPAHPRPVEAGLAHDYLQILSSWMVRSGVENEFTINGKEYPATQALDVRSGDRIRIRWINISGEEFHTMHTHGHYQQVIARDAQPVETKDVEDTVLVGPGQRADVVVTANARPGTWLIHCHVMDHIEDAAGMPDGLIAAIHYAGTPNVLGSMDRAMKPQKSMGAPGSPLSFGMTVVLGGIAGLTIFLGLPVARARRASPQLMAVLNALAIGILLYLVIEISRSAILPITQAVGAWHATGTPFPALLVFVFIAGLLLGLVGLGSVATKLTKSAAANVSDPIVLSTIIAIGIGAHNFGEGLAIGASAASGATAIALALIVGFGLHNATEGFGVAAPLVGRVVPTWAQIGLAGLIAGGPTFVGTMIGYYFYSPVLSVLFLSIAIGALVFVIGELWSLLKRFGLTPLVTTVMTLGFIIAFATEVYLDINGG